MADHNCQQVITNEDTVQTMFFSSSFKSDNEFWEDLCNRINSTVKTVSKGYIWHRDEFKVCLPIFSDVDCDLPKHLISTTCFGDNIEDEWFIIYIILELSKKNPDLIIQVTDNDGDFLLIEAADYLPSWANPETTENRVFICNNEIHLIPPNLADLKSKLTITEALQYVVNYPKQTKVSTEVQNAMFSRIGQYPAKITENMQRVIAYLPLEIATILTLDESLIAPIVTTYCNHDIIDVKSCTDGSEFTDYVYCRVNFTKCLYAMLMHSKLIRGGNSKNTTEDKKHELGLKITFGFQMLMKTSISKDIFSTNEFSVFKNNLTKNGYFRNNIEGSKDYNILLDKAKKYFLDMECPISTYTSSNVLKIMDSDEFVKCKASLKDLNITNKYLTEDSDDWLCIKPSELNNMLNNRYSNGVKFCDENIVTPEIVTTKLTDFLKKSSDFEGIETKNDNFNNNNIEFDADQFVDCLEKMLNLVSDDMNSDFESDSEYDDDDLSENELDKELATKLNSYPENVDDKKKVMFSLVKSIKEEGLSGPSSNLLSSIGVKKTDLLDSDDD